MSGLQKVIRLTYDVAATEQATEVTDALIRFERQKVCPVSFDWGREEGRVFFQHTDAPQADQMQQAEREFRLQLAEVNLRINDPTETPWPENQIS